MKEVKLWIHDGRLYQTPYYVWNSEVEQVIKEWKESVFPIAKEKNLAHFVYATKTYGDDNQLLEVDLYAVPLDDIEFSKRTEEMYLNKKKNGHLIWFGVWHKGTSY